jgi:competence protein ComEA
MKKALKDYFTFSSRERTGMLVLLILVILAIVINCRLRYFPNQQKRYDYSGYNRELELFRSSLSYNEAVPEDYTRKTSPPGIRLFLFDPNTATVGELIRLGVDEKIAGRIQAYRIKGGRFMKKEDLLKIYGFDPVLFTRLSPYITLQKRNKATDVQEPQNYREIRPDSRIEINSCDGSGLKRLQGIGPVLASRIVKYRGLLGGYYSVDQLTEVYGISDSLFLAVKEHVRIDTSLVRKISLNKASETQLSTHPYIGRYMAKAILTYRESTGCISSIEELVKNKIIPEERKNRIKAYCVFE